MILGKLVKIAQTNITSNTASVVINGISEDAPYLLTYDDVYFDSGDDLRIRVTTSGTPDSDSEYDQGQYIMYHDTTHGGSAATDQTQWDVNQTSGTDTNDANNGYLWLYNFNLSSEFSAVLGQSMGRNTAQSRWGHYTWAGFHSVAETNDGIAFHANGGNNIANGNFCLYRLAL
jgi:hypothetical protein